MHFPSLKYQLEKGTRSSPDFKELNLSDWKIIFLFSLYIYFSIFLIIVQEFFRNLAGRYRRH